MYSKIAIPIHFIIRRKRNLGNKRATSEFGRITRTCVYNLSFFVTIYTKLNDQRNYMPIYIKRSKSIRFNTFAFTVIFATDM